jgi:hypothetical protein
MRGPITGLVRLVGVGLRAVVVAGSVVVALALLSGAATAAGVRAGNAVVIDGLDGSRVLAGGGSATSFSLELPADASCPGDSTNDNYRVQSFIVPAADDPGALTFESQKPSGDGRWALYDVNTTPFSQVLTDVSDGPGQPGRVPALPQLSFAVFDPGTFPAGPYRIGVACTLWSETIRYWDAVIEVSDDPADEPAQIRWVAVGQSAPSDGDGSATAALVGVSVVGVAVAVVVVAIVRRRFPSVPVAP